MIYVYIDLLNSPIMGAFLWRHVQGHFFSVSESLLIVTWTFVNTSCLKLLHGCAATVNQDLWQLTLWIHIIIIFDSALSQSILINIMTLILHGPALACVARPQIICNQFFQFIVSQAFPVLGCLMTNVQMKHCLKWTSWEISIFSIVASFSVLLVIRFWMRLVAMPCVALRMKSSEAPIDFKFFEAVLSGYLYH